MLVAHGIQFVAKHGDRRLEAVLRERSRCRGGEDRRRRDAEIDEARIGLRQRAGQPRHRVVAAAARDLLDGGALVRRPRRHLDGGDDLVIGKGGLEQAEEELRRADPPFAARGNGQDARLKGHEAGRQLGCGIGIGEITADRAAVADRGVGDQRYGLREQRGKGCDIRRTAEFRMRRQRADAQAVLGRADTLECGDARDVDERRRRREAKGKGGQKALAAGHHLGVRSRLLEQAPQFIQRRRLGVSERRPLHRRPSRTRTIRLPRIALALHRIS